MSKKGRRRGGIATYTVPAKSRRQEGYGTRGMAWPVYGTDNKILTWKVYDYKANMVEAATDEEIKEAAAYFKRLERSTEKSVRVKREKGARGVAARREISREQRSLAIKVKLPGDEAVMRADGKIWSKVSSYGGTVYKMLTAEEVQQALTGQKDGPELEPELLKEPPLDWMLPRSFLREWVAQLLRVDTEALCIYGKWRKTTLPEGTPLWLGVVPKQEVSAASVDVDDLGPASVLLSKMGYKRVGNIHTHPGGGIAHASSIDTGEDLWDGFGGVHIVVSRIGGASYYYSIGGHTWILSDEKDSPWRIAPLWKTGNTLKAQSWCSSLIGETGSKKITKMIEHKVYRVVRTSYPGYAAYQGEEKTKVCVFHICGNRYVWSETKRIFQEVTIVGSIDHKAMKTGDKPNTTETAAEEMREARRMAKEEMKDAETLEDASCIEEALGNARKYLLRMDGAGDTLTQMVQLSSYFKLVKKMYKLVRIFQRTLSEDSLAVNRLPHLEIVADQLLTLELELVGLDGMEDADKRVKGKGNKDETK